LETILALPDQINHNQPTDLQITQSQNYKSTTITQNIQPKEFSLSISLTKEFTPICVNHIEGGRKEKIGEKAE
jgi:hypothetical protein